MSDLGQFLREKKEQVETSKRPAELIRTWTDAVARLEERIRAALEPYRADGLTIEDWNLALHEQGLPYNLTALTVHFLDYQVEILPKGAPGRGPGRVEMSCGAKVVWLLWASGERWSYKWEYPAYDEGPKALTDEAIEDLVRELLA
jgi:hypothetical protein